MNNLVWGRPGQSERKGSINLIMQDSPTQADESILRILIITLHEVVVLCKLCWKLNHQHCYIVMNLVLNVWMLSRAWILFVFNTFVHTSLSNRILTGGCACAWGSGVGCQGSGRIATTVFAQRLQCQASGIFRQLVAESFQTMAEEHAGTSTNTWRTVEKTTKSVGNSHVKTTLAFTQTSQTTSEHVRPCLITGYSFNSKVRRKYNFTWTCTTCVARYVNQIPANFTIQFCNTSLHWYNTRYYSCRYSWLPSNQGIPLYPNMPLQQLNSFITRNNTPHMYQHLLKLVVIASFLK